MKKTFRIKMDTEFTIDFEDWDLSDEQQRKIESFKKMVINEYFDACMYEDVDVTEKKPIELFETMAELFNPNKK